MLAADEDAGLDDGVAGAGRGDGGDFLFREDATQAVASLVVAEEAGNGGLGPERGEIERHVGRAARAVAVALEVDDGHGRLGRDALRVTPDVVVEHHVADDEDAEFGNFPEEGFHQRISNS